MIFKFSNMTIISFAAIYIVSRTLRKIVNQNDIYRSYFLVYYFLFLYLCGYDHLF